MPTATSWIALGLLLLMLVAGAVWLWRWAQRKDDDATEAAIKGAVERIRSQRADVLSDEQQRTDREALSWWQRNFGSSRRE